MSLSSENEEIYHNAFTNEQFNMANNIENLINEIYDKKQRDKGLMKNIASNRTGNIRNILNPIYKLFKYNEKLQEQIDEIIFIMNNEPETIFDIIDDISRRTFLYDKGLTREKTGYKNINGRETFISFFNRNDPSVYKDIDIYNSNLLICTLFIILGIINNFMENTKKCKYKLLFKGGRILNKHIKDVRPELHHQSFDIDVIVFPKYKKQPKNIQSVLNLYNLNESVLISSLIMQLIYEKLERNTRSIDLSVLPPRGNNPLIHKLSYISKYGHGFIPLLDLAHGWKANDVDHSKTIPYFLDHVDEKENIQLNNQNIMMKYSFQTYESLFCEKRFIQSMNTNHADKRTKKKIKNQINGLKQITSFYPVVNCRKFNKINKTQKSKIQNNELHQFSRSKPRRNNQNKFPGKSRTMRKK